MRKLLLVLFIMVFMGCSSTENTVVTEKPKVKSSIEVIKSLKVTLNDSYDDLVSAYGEGQRVAQKSNNAVDVIYYEDLGVSFFIDKNNGRKIINIAVD